MHLFVKCFNFVYLRVRKMKERYLITEMRKQANRMSFGEVCIHYSKCNPYSDLPPRCNLAAVEIGPRKIWYIVLHA